MAKMYGDRGREHYDSPDNKIKNYFKHREDTQWRLELADELYDPHTNGICYTPNAGYGCIECYDDSDYFDAGELDGIVGVTTNAERLI